jgi:hypothetical protein
VPVRVNDTPGEFIVSFVTWATNLSQEEYWDELLAPVLQNACYLVDCYVQAIYTSRLLNSLDQRRVIWAWQKLRWHLWLARVRRIRLFGRELVD